MQRWLKSITPDRHALEKLWCLKPFIDLGIDRGCWAFKRTSVIRAFSLGLLIAFIPPTPLPLHLTLCVLFGMLFRLNIPVLVATVFLSNPLTWFAQIAGSIWIGAKLMDLDLMPMLQELGHHDLWARRDVWAHHDLWVHLKQLWKPLLLGAFVLGVLSAGLGYTLGQLAWRARILYQLRRRRLRSSLRGAAFHQNSID
jgi:uncharacterized protein